VKHESSEALAKIPAMSKGVGRSEGQFKKWALLGGSISAAMLGVRTGKAKETVVGQV
jgi:hypothetical protein